MAMPMLTLAIVAALFTVAQPAGDGGDGSDQREGPPTWRFKRDDRPVKVVVVAGSIGAWQRQPYAAEVERLCRNVEVKNLSKVGLGAWALKRRFEEQVLANRRVDPHAEGTEHWLMFGGGLNSIGSPLTTNKHIRNLFVKAHAAGFKVVALSPTPWGDESDRRFRGIDGLKYRKATQAVTDFIMGRSSPRNALGSWAERRPGGADAPWLPEELADIAVDLYDSDLRDKNATLRDREAMREALRKDRTWQRQHADLDEVARVTALELDASMAAELPRWYLRAELRSFDHIHPNAEGHRLIAATMCPLLPESWSCTCE